MAKKRQRRNWSGDETCRTVAQTGVPGVSVSQVAQRYDVNANLVFKWLQDPRFCLHDETEAQFSLVETVANPDSGGRGLAQSVGTIEIRLNNGHRLSLSGTFDPDLVCRLVRGLGGLSLFLLLERCPASRLAKPFEPNTLKKRSNRSDSTTVDARNGRWRRARRKGGKVACVRRGRHDEGQVTSFEPACGK